MAGLFNVRVLSHVLSVGTLTGYSVVAACVVVLRFVEKTGNQAPFRWSSRGVQGVLCLVSVALCGFATGVIYRFNAQYYFLAIPISIAIAASAALYFRHDYDVASGFSCPGVPILPAVCIFFNIFLFAQDGSDLLSSASFLSAFMPYMANFMPTRVQMDYDVASGFSCPGVPILPAVCIFFNIFLFAQLHMEGWIRFVVISFISVSIYAVYGQFHANPSSDGAIYLRAPETPR
ncbi:Cationic amino acid transporter 9, chloroplastic-like protein [Drosera capensis]